MQASTKSFSKISIAFNTALFLSMLFIFIPKAQAEYPCPLGFYDAVNEGCVPNYNTYSNVVWGTTVVPSGYGYSYNGAVYNHGYYPAAGYHDDAVGHYNFGGANYYHRNWGGGSYYRR